MTTPTRPRTHAARGLALGLAAAIGVTGCGGCRPTPTPSTEPSPQTGGAKVQLVDFDENGAPTSPDQLKAVTAALDPANKVTDVFILVHGWNNSASDAEQFAQGIAELVGKVSKENKLAPPDGYNPLFVGVRWPSKAWDPPPREESVAPPVMTADQKEALRESLPATAAPPADRARDLEQLERLIAKRPAEKADWDEAHRLFRKYAIRPEKLKVAAPDDESLFDPPPAAEGRVPSLRDRGFPSIGDAARVFTYWQMKKRAGVVGETGGRALLDEIQRTSPPARVHLFGHSFGTKLILSALIAPSAVEPRRPVRTVVLAQPAISYQAFADAVTGTNPARPGGYKPALTAVDGVLAATFSTKDLPLREAYPRASWLRGQVGELEVVSRFSAMGAVGIDSVAATAMVRNGEPYAFPADTRVFSVAGSELITGHSDVRTDAVAWLLWSAANRR